ncbi:membrane dipeptidase [Archangium lansingense]|uniref:Membrane dipeptidase n=1 Tax=Archangium lansingense TaxID=2995310 RepID=A0ABT4A2L1_9BACT|nr:membrane dipeptidase [Archangium lansinium]MCY1075836.1 membrane dipeptidase [Archangium lansinium]
MMKMLRFAVMGWVLCCASPALAAPYWGTFQSDACTGVGQRQKSSVLWGIPSGTSWETACANTGATIDGRWYARPNRCVRTSTNMWGEFDVPDTSCNPNWSTFKQDRCTDSGRRQHSAQLLNIPPNTSWESACQATGATVAGYTFLRPTRCVNKGTSGMWGEFEVNDTTCNPVTECNSSLPAGTFTKSGNSGSVSCEAFCANRDANWGQRGTCVRGLVTSGPHAGSCLACTDVAADQGDTGVTCTCKAPAKGFADLHAHPFANLAFGGLAFYGKAYGPLSSTLPWCDTVHGPGGTRDSFGSIMATLGYGTGGSGHRVGGYPQYDGWPRWNSYTHQSMYEDWLYRSVQGGLRLLVMLAVNNQDIFGFPIYATKAPGRTGEDMEAVDLQIAEAYAMQSYLDNKAGGAGRGWFRIVKTPAEARTVIAQGKLAVVLGAEVDYLFDCRRNSSCTSAYVEERLDHYQAMGLRHLFPIHFKQNAFAGSALTSITTEGDSRDCKQEGYVYKRDIAKDPICGAQGLTTLGRTLVRGMMRRKMLIDIDHMSKLAFDDTLGMVEPYGYPVVSGHTTLFDTARGNKRHEGSLKAEQLQRIRNVGGMVSLILDQGNRDEIPTWRGAGQPVVDHQCGSTSQSWAQAYLYLTKQLSGMPVGFGTDFNGFAGLPSPRFGAEACHGGSSAAQVARTSYPLSIAVENSVTKLERSVVGNKVFDINEDGVAHAGMMPDFISDLRRQGLRSQDLDPLMNSAEGYLQVWERAEAIGATVP